MNFSFNILVFFMNDLTANETQVRCAQDIITISMKINVLIIEIN